MGFIQIFQIRSNNISIERACQADPHSKMADSNVASLRRYRFLKFKTCQTYGVCMETGEGSFDVLFMHIQLDAPSSTFYGCCLKSCSSNTFHRVHHAAVSFSSAHQVVIISVSAHSLSECLELVNDIWLSANLIGCLS